MPVHLRSVPQPAAMCALPRPSTCGVCSWVQGAGNCFTALCEAIVSWRHVGCEGLHNELIQLMQVRAAWCRLALGPHSYWLGPACDAMALCVPIPAGLQGAASGSGAVGGGDGQPEPRSAAEAERHVPAGLSALLWRLADHLLPLYPRRRQRSGRHSRGGNQRTATTQQESAARHQLLHLQCNPAVGHSQR